MREITIKYAGNCKRCNKDLEIGQAAMYEKSMGCFCIGCEPKDTEEIRHFRSLKAEKKAERLLNRAGRLESEAKGKMAAFNHYRKDIAFITQPGHIPGRDKIFNRYDKGLEMLNEAQSLKEKVESIQHVRVKGDAEKKRQAVRDAIDSQIAIGSKVYDFCFGEGIIKRINQKTYTIQFASGGTYPRDKSYVKVL